VSGSVTVRVPAKVNVFLGVGDREFNGYHDLATIFQAVSVYDEVTVTRAAEMSLTVTGAFADVVPTDSTNLAWRAAELIAQACGEQASVSISIAKNIPVAGGMAGGSADAAATLLACDELWKANIPRDQLDAIAAQLGADVPFMLHGGCALGLGRGDLLSPIMTRGNFHWVFAISSGGLSTADVYNRLDELRLDDDQEVDVAVPEELMFALAQGDAKVLARHMHNDLQRAAIDLKSELAEVLSYGRQSGALAAVVSGSGPTCAFLASSESSAIDLVVALKSSGLVRDAIHAHGPVHGARVVPQ